MRSTRTFAGLAAAALLFTFTGCGDDADDSNSSTAPEDTMPAETAAESDATEPEEPAEDGPSPCPEAPEEWRDDLAAASPPAPAPGGLTVGILPDDIDAATALFDALPDALIGGDKAVPAGLSPGFVEVNYPTPDRSSRDGFQAHDLRDSMFGSILPEPRADLLTGFFVVSDDDDYTVEAAGHEGDLYWVTYIATNSGFGIDGVEEVYTITWGEACSPIAFIAQAPTDAERDELVAAFIDAATEAA